MQDYFLLENTLAQVLKKQEEKTELEKAIQSSKSKLREERRSGEGLSEESIKLNGRYTETGLDQEMSTTEKEIDGLKKKKSEQKNKLENFEGGATQFTFLIGGILVICVLLAAWDLHGDLQEVPFICNNNEVVLASVVEDEVADCSDGSDEGDTFLGTSRAEEFEMDVANGAWMAAFMGSIAFIPVSWYVITQSRNNKALRSLMMILLFASSSVLYLQFDVNGTWECDNGEEIHKFHVLDGKQNCSDGSDESESGFWASSDEWTRAEHSESGDILFDFSLLFWIIAVLIYGIWWLLHDKLGSHLEIFQIPDTSRILEKEMNLTKQKLSSKRGKHTGLKNKKNRLIELPNLVELSNKSAFALEEKIAIMEERVKALDLAISNEMEKVSHMIPYSNS